MARTASRDARRLKSTVRSQATQVKDEVTAQGRAVLDEAKLRVAEQTHVQVRRAADGLTKLAKGTRALAEGAPGEDAGLGGYLFQGSDKLYQAADRVYRLADDVEAGDLDQLLAEFQAFARRRPAAFLVGAAAAGFGLGRILRASAGEDDDEADDEYEDAEDYAEVGRGARALPRTSTARSAAAGGR